MTKVVNLAAFKCPTGTMATHRLYGLVDVIAQDDWMRCVLYEHHEPLDLADEAEDVLFAENIEVREDWVHVRELTEANLAKDIEELYRRSIFSSTEKIELRDPY